MIRFDDVTIRYAPGATPVLANVDLSIGEGEFVLVTGPTGAGKSTLLRACNGLVPHFTGGELTGRVLVGGTSTADAPVRAFAHLVGSVGQDPLAGFVTERVEDELAYGMEQLGVDPQLMRRRVEETLDLLGIADLRDRALRTLSGGQQQRVAIGSVLAMHPPVLVLDEPTSALDPTAAEEVLATLARLVHDLDTTVILAEHRLERVLPFVDRIVHVAGDGRVQSGLPGELLDTLELVPPIVELGRRAGWSPLPITVRDARRAARSDPPTRRDRPTPPAPAPRTVALRARGVDVDHGAVRAVRGVDLELHTGEVSALMGRNGAGKSSLLWALHGAGDRRRGTVTPSGTVVLVPQTASDLLLLETVEQECAAADARLGGAPGSCRARLDRITPDIADATHPRDLSAGSQLALALAIQLGAEPAVVLLDEPTRGLDYCAKRALARIVHDLAARGSAVVVATHDVEFAAIVADHAIVLADGEVVAHGPAATILAGSPAFAPQVAKVLGDGWLVVDDVLDERSAVPT